MLQPLRERLALILIVLLPFHAFLVTVLTRMFFGPGNPPWAGIALWKEFLLGVMIVLAFFEIVRGVLVEEKALSPKRWIQAFCARCREKPSLRLDLIDWVIALLIILAILVTTFTHGDGILFLYGVKYSLLPLIAFLFLRRVPWSKEFQSTVLRVLVLVGSMVAALGVISFYLPQSFFTLLGYSDLHSLYIPSSPIAAFQQIGDFGLRRIQSTMSGPNQLGIWLLLPLTIWLVTHLQKKKVFGSLSLFMGVALFAALTMTFSRSAWLSALLIIIVTLWIAFPWKRTQKYLIRLAVPVVFAVIVLAVISPETIYRVASTRDHLLKPAEAVQTMVRHPLGLGLGSAGPASNRVSDSCVYLEQDADYTWALSHSELCVFVGGKQVLPVSRTCRCPLVTENWYLQFGVELGWLGLLLSVALTVLILLRLKQGVQKSESSAIVFLVFIGVSVAALFLHAWEDAALAYTMWILLSAVVGCVHDVKRFS